MTLTFEWDEEKAEQNASKHGIRFEEAKTAFNDPFSITVFDPDHSADENRYIDVGRSSRGRILVVSYTERDKKIRIISSRLATKRERRDYENR